MFFGLKNAFAFQKMMDTVFRELIERHYFTYLDIWIIIFGNTIQKHNQNLAIVLQILKDLKFKIQSDKCEFLKHEKNT